MSRPLKWMLGITIALVLMLVLAGGVFLLEVPFFAVFGWIWYLFRVLPQITLDWATIGFACAAVGVFGVGLHWFLHWLAAGIRGDESGGNSDATSDDAVFWKPKWTAAIVALSLLLFVAGTAFVGIVHQIAWLAKSPVPLLEGGIRQAAMRNQSTSQLKQLALGVLNLADANPAVYSQPSDGSSRPIHSWQTDLLPYIEEHGLYVRVRRDLPWDHDENRASLSMSVSTYVSPYSSRSGMPLHNEAGYALTDYAANKHVVKDGTPIDFKGMTDGASRTLLHGEALENRRPWGKPGNVRDPAVGINRTPDGFNGYTSSGGAVFSFADGRTTFLSQDIDPRVLKALSTPTGGEEIDGLSTSKQPGNSL